VHMSMPILNRFINMLSNGLGCYKLQLKIRFGFLEGTRKKGVVANDYYT
jgi:hypothetical protein